MELNARQRKAIRNINAAANWLLGGYENTLLDFAPDSEEYKSAKAILGNHDRLVDMLYDSATTEVYSSGCVSFGKEAERFMKDIRFCGKEWLLNACDRKITKEGY